MPASITAETMSTDLLRVNGGPTRTGGYHFLRGHVILAYGMLLDPRLWPTPATWLVWQVPLGPFTAFPGPG